MKNPAGIPDAIMRRAKAAFVALAERGVPVSVAERVLGVDIFTAFPDLQKTAESEMTKHAMSLRLDPVYDSLFAGVYRGVRSRGGSPEQAFVGIVKFAAMFPGIQESVIAHSRDLWMAYGMEKSGDGFGGVGLPRPITIPTEEDIEKIKALRPIRDEVHHQTPAMPQTGTASGRQSFWSWFFGGPPGTPRDAFTGGRVEDQPVVTGVPPGVPPGAAPDALAGREVAEQRAEQDALVAQRRDIESRVSPAPLFGMDPAAWQKWRWAVPVATTLLGGTLGGGYGRGGALGGNILGLLGGLLLMNYLSGGGFGFPPEVQKLIGAILGGIGISPRAAPPGAAPPGAAPPGAAPPGAAPPGAAGAALPGAKQFDPTMVGALLEKVPRRFREPVAQVLENYQQGVLSPEDIAILKSLVKHADPAAAAVLAEHGLTPESVGGLTSAVRLPWSLR